MQTSEQSAAEPAAAPNHLRVQLSEPWPHRGNGAEVTGWVPARRTGDAAAAELAGRAVLAFACGPFDLSLDPTPAELRALAHLCTLLADELDGAIARERVARQLAGEGVA